MRNQTTRSESDRFQWSLTSCLPFRTAKISVSWVTSGTWCSMFFIPWCCMTYRGTCLSKGFGLATSPVSPAGDVACCHLHDRISANGILRDARLTLEVNQALWLVWSTLSLKILHLSLCLSFARFCELLTICDKEIVIQFEMLQPWSDWDKKVGDCISIASLKGTLSISL